FVTSASLVDEGLVASLARPTGNATGLTQQAGDEDAKRLQLLKEAVPAIQRVAGLWNQATARAFAETRAAADVLGIQLLSLELRSVDELDAVLNAAAGGRVDGLVVMGAAQFVPLAQRIADFAAINRLPAIYSSTSYVQAGGL